MKKQIKNLPFAILAIAAATSTLAAPCWSWSNECGSIPACDGRENHPYGDCTHTYCDDQATCQYSGCSSSGSTKRVRKSTREIWLNEPLPGGGNSYCVMAPTYTESGECCNCNRPALFCNVPVIPGS